MKIAWLFNHSMAQHSKTKLSRGLKGITIIWTDTSSMIAFLTVKKPVIQMLIIFSNTVCSL